MVFQGRKSIFLLLTSDVSDVNVFTSERAKAKGIGRTPALNKSFMMEPYVEIGKS